MVTTRQVGELRTKLEERHQQLRDEIRQELLASDEEHYIDLAGQVHDLDAAPKLAPHAFRLRTK